MLFGLCTGDPARIRRCREWGYDFADIGARTVLPFEPDAAWHPRRRELQDSGTPMLGLGGFIPAEARFVGPDVDWDRVRGYLETVVGRASELGVRVFNWGSPQSKSVPPGWPFSKAFEQIERAAHLIADVMAPHGCVAAIEPINPLECNVIYYLTDAVQLARSVDRPQIRVNVDYYHVALQNEPLAHIASAREWIVHAHTSGPRRDFPKPGDGFDHPAFLGALKGIGYDAAISFECGGAPDFDRAAPAGVAYYRDLWAR